MPKDIDGGIVSLSSIARISPEKADRLARHKLHKGDIVFPRRGEISKCALIREHEEGFICGTGCLKIVVPDSAYSSAFLHYYLRLPFAVGWLENHAVGTTMLNLNTSILGAIPVPETNRDVQDKVVELTRVYDDLIENNRRRIKLLEEAARLIYREWFVRLRFPGHEHTKIENGVPEGWRRVPVTQMIDFNPSERLLGESITFVPMSALSGSGMTVNLAEIEVRESGTTVKFRNHDTLLARITPCLENGKTAYVGFLSEDEVGSGSTEFIVMRGQSVGPTFTYCLARSDEFRGKAIASMIGSSGRQRVQVGAFGEFRCLEPTTKITNEFEDVVRPSFEMIWKLTKANAKLGLARDLLLPRLMSGEIDV